MAVAVAVIVAGAFAVFVVVDEELVLEELVEVV